MTLDQNDQLYYFDLLNPSYTIFHTDDETFSSTWTQYDPSFPAFYQNYLDDMQQYGNNHGMLARTPREDCFDISCLPWATFTEFHLDLPDARRFLLPIFTFGKYFEQDGCLCPFRFIMLSAMDFISAALSMNVNSLPINVKRGCNEKSLPKWEAFVVSVFMIPGTNFVGPSFLFPIISICLIPSGTLCKGAKQIKHRFCLK